MKSFIINITKIERNEGLKKIEVIKEEMVFYGPDKLSIAELLSIAVGTKNGKLLRELDKIGIRKLAESTLEEYKQIPGVTENIAYKLNALFTLAKKLHASKRTDVEVIRSPADAAALLSYLRYEKQEHFVCLYLNTKNEVLSRRTIFIGSLNSSIVHPREIFKEAYRVSAASVILAHQHPSGNPTPSEEDVEVTKRIMDSGVILGIDVLDHIIIGDNTFVSLKEKGYM